MEKKDIQQIKDIVDEEGLGYAIQHYLNSKTIGDVELKKLWNAAEIALSEIEDYLEKH